MAKTISSKHIIPKEICDSTSCAIFLFFFYPGKTFELLNQITLHIEGMDQDILDKIEKKLDLGLRLSSWDTQGNVCFANDPDLRPEYRTTFQPIDLWDYYYAHWHTSEYWNKLLDVKDDLLLPHPDYFWESVQYGGRLRDVQSQKMRIQTKTALIANTDNMFLQPLYGRFIPDHQDELKGHLYLNEDMYLNNVSKLDWEYQLGDVQPMRQWVNQHMDQLMTSQDFDDLFRLIQSVGSTRHIQKLIDEYLK